ncbi:MAG: hypothetical protein A2W98_04330 [Bacteroidetes bacterium GWF2_33_38]|nr:MAG: hypothetical protein A2W98_04330 [Bacteroidetes bacterium GWF2_33_38]
MDLPGEVWKELKFTERRYDVSNKGRVKSYFFKEDGKIISPGYIKDFAVVNLKVDGKIKSYYVHKLVADAFIKKDKEAGVVIHLDWNARNNEVENLKWISKVASYTRMHARLAELRLERGKLVTAAKLSVEDVKAIKSMIKKGVKAKVIAKMFCISEMQISRIKNGFNWSEVTID